MAVEITAKVDSMAVELKSLKSENEKLRKQLND